MRYIGAKNKLARRENTDLGLKTAGSKSHSNLIKRLNIIPGQHGTRRRRKASDFGIQLREKQKLKRMYGISERQMRNYFETAKKRVGNTTDLLVQMLEHRLDNVVYKMGLAPTRACARQLISHNHVSINKERVTIASFQIKKGDVVSFVSEETAKIPYLEQWLRRDDIVVLPNWLQRKGTIGQVTGVSSMDHLKELVDLQMVIEFYSR